MGESRKSNGEAKPSVMGNMVTAKELAQFLKLSKAKIYKLAFGGEIPGFKIGDSWRFDMEEVMQLLKDRTQPVNKTNGLLSSPGRSSRMRSYTGPPPEKFTEGRWR
jgi:excisionase family DNA binding protein